MIRSRLRTALPSSPALLAAFLLGCLDPTSELGGGEIDAVGPAPGGAPAAVDGSLDATEPTEPAIAPMSTDMCGTASPSTWASASSQHVTIHFLPGSPAERAQGEILERLEGAYTAISGALGVTGEPTVTAYLSPSRADAVANGRGYGGAYPASGRYEVIYTGAPDSYEVQRYGHELTHVIEYHLDPASRYRHPMMSEGLAEYLDQSGRNLHHAYAEQLLSNNESRVRVADLESRDLSGRNYGRAGSLIQFLVERYGWDTFLDISRATSVSWIGGCWTHEAVGCIGTPEALTAMLDDALTRTVGEGWEDVRPAWEAEVQIALATVDVSMPAAAVAEIENLVRVMDEAVTGDDAAMYRSTMDGFYCDWGGEAMREEIAARAVDAYTMTRSQVVSILPTGIKNFATAQVVIRRSDERGVATFQTLSLEHFPSGWRVTYGPDWY